jgi:HlyD family secretion protein
MPRPPQNRTPGNKASKSDAQKVWIERDGQAVAVPVTVGTNNGRQTEITGGELSAGTRVITDYQESKS